MLVGRHGSRSGARGSNAGNDDGADDDIPGHPRARHHGIDRAMRCPRPMRRTAATHPHADAGVESPSDAPREPRVAAAQPRSARVRAPTGAPMLCCAVLRGCTIEQDSNPFGAATVAASSTLGVSSSPGDGGSDGSGSGSDTSGSTSVGATASGDTGSSGAAGSDDAGSSSGSDGDSGDPSGGGNGMQPQDGMYSPCTTPQECGFTPILCITIQDMMGNPQDGFCSQTGCASPAVDCAVSPGGTATPTCVPVTIDGAAEQACALDCSGGKTCPPPMTCYDVTSLGMVCA